MHVVAIVHKALGNWAQVHGKIKKTFLYCLNQTLLHCTVYVYSAKILRDKTFANVMFLYIEHEEILMQLPKFSANTTRVIQP